MKNIIYTLILLILVDIAALDEPINEPINEPHIEPHNEPEDEEFYVIQDEPLDVPQDVPPGELSEVHKPYPELIKLLAKFATAKITEILESPYHLKVTDISNVTEWVRIGRLYKMTLNVAPTMCEIYGGYIDDECPLQDCYEKTTCNVEIWSQVWLESEEKLQLFDGSCEHGENTCQET